MSGVEIIKDSLGRELTQKQKKLFKHSTVITSFGDLEVCYKLSLDENLPINWFTSDKDECLKIKKEKTLKEYYLNCYSIFNCSNVTDNLFSRNKELSPKFKIILYVLGLSTVKFEKSFKDELETLSEDATILEIINTDKFRLLLRDLGHDCIKYIDKINNREIEYFGVLIEDCIHEV